MWHDVLREKESGKFIYWVSVTSYGFFTLPVDVKMARSRWFHAITDHSDVHSGTCRSEYTFHWTPEPHYTIVKWSQKWKQSSHQWMSSSYFSDSSEGPQWLYQGHLGEPQSLPTVTEAAPRWAIGNSMEIGVRICGCFEKLSLHNDHNKCRCLDFHCGWLQTISTAYYLTKCNHAYSNYSLSSSFLSPVTIRNND